MSKASASTTKPGASKSKEDKTAQGKERRYSSDSRETDRQRDAEQAAKLRARLAKEQERQAKEEREKAKDKAKEKEKDQQAKDKEKAYKERVKKLAEEKAAEDKAKEEERKRREKEKRKAEEETDRRNGIGVARADGVLEPYMLTDYPTEGICPYCHSLIVTELIYKIGGLTWLLCLGGLLMGPWFCCCAFPFCIKLGKNVLHGCPKCNAVIGSYNRLSHNTL